MLSQKAQSISIRQSRPATSTMLYSPDRSCVSSASSPVPWSPLRTTSLRHTGNKSSDNSSVDSRSKTRTSWHSDSSNDASSNTSIYERSTDLDKNVTQQIETEIYRIGVVIAQSSSLKDALQQQHGNHSLGHPTTNLNFALPVPQMQDVSLALTDARVLGDPIFMSTAGFEVGPAGLRIGHCSYLNLPPGDCCTMRIVGPTCADSRPRFQLIISTTVLDVRTTDKSWKLSSIHDVTDMVNEMATDRLTNGLNMQSTFTREDGQGVAPEDSNKITTSRDERFDWNEFTEMESATHDQGPKGVCRSQDRFDAPNDIFRFIQGADLLRSRTKQFFILTPRPLEPRKRNVIEVFRRKKAIWAIEIANLVVSFVSNDLRNERQMLDRLSNHLGRCTTDIVTKCFGGTEGFEWRATLRPGVESVINCLPVDNDRDAMAREVWWVCFVETRPPPTARFHLAATGAPCSRPAPQ